jgi:hypothetical protein
MAEIVSAPICFMRLDDELFNLPEFKSLDPEAQAFFREPGRPHLEILKTVSKPESYFY